jgi:hypothetical protein
MVINQIMFLGQRVRIKIIKAFTPEFYGDNEGNVRRYQKSYDKHEEFDYMVTFIT